MNSGGDLLREVASRDKACTVVLRRHGQRPVSPGPETEGLSTCVNIEPVYAYGRGNIVAK